MLRRLEKRILVPLPNNEARVDMFKHNLPEILPDLQESGQIVKTHLNYQELGEVYINPNVLGGERFNSSTTLLKIIN